MARILVDTGAVYALLDTDDAKHAPAQERLERLRRHKMDPFLTNFLVAECHALLLARLGAAIARRWLLESAWRVERVTEADEEHARRIIVDYEDKTFSYTDATSFAVMDRLRIRKCFAFDRHFEQYGFEPVT